MPDATPTGPRSPFMAQVLRDFETVVDILLRPERTGSHAKQNYCRSEKHDCADSEEKTLPASALEFHREGARVAAAGPSLRRRKRRDARSRPAEKRMCRSRAQPSQRADHAHC